MILLNKNNNYNKFHILNLFEIKVNMVVILLIYSSDINKVRSDIAQSPVLKTVQRA